MTNDNKKKAPALNLFDYTEEELLHSDPPVVTYYQILNCPEYATQNEVKKAYRKASLKYHPDKTGRGENDYVFLAVKAAHDTLMDHAKRQAYDSTVIPFDDGIPSPREKLIQDSTLLYTDDDFYDTFGPVFLRNLRFDLRLRPDLANKSANKKKQNHEHHTPPTLGDANTPLAQVHKFYEYWVHFESWRDFSTQAAEELKVENELENAESRFEKRWIQKEIDKRAKQLKRAELQRIQTLVERAMDADPRLRKERMELILQKEQAAAARAAAKEQQKKEKERQAQQQAQEEQEEIERQKQEKIQREKEKKLIRKERQVMRKLSKEAYDSDKNTTAFWKDSYDLSQDVDYLCQQFDTLETIKEFNEQLQEQEQEQNSILKLIHERVAQEKQLQEEKDKQNEKNNAQETATTTNGSTKTNQSSNNHNNPWTKDELSALAKGVKKYPPGGASRWEQITLFVNNLCKQHIPRSREECIEKYNKISRDAANANKDTADTTAAASSSNNNLKNGTTAPAANATTTADGDGGWTDEQDQHLQDALAKYPANMDKNERWTSIANSVPGKTKKQCVQRFKAIREALLKSKQ